MFRIVAALAAFALAILPASGDPAGQPPLEIQSIQSLTGTAAFTGLTEQKTLALIESLVNRTGGIRGRPIKIVYSDDESNPQLAVQLMSGFAAAHIPFVLGPGLTATCQAVLAVIEKDGPLMLCGSPGVVPPAGSYGIAGGPTVDTAMLVLMRYFRDRGWTRIGVIASTDASGQAYVKGIQTAQALPEMKDVQIVALERMNPTDISVIGQLAHIKAANPQALFTMATGTPWGTIMRGVKELGIAVPIGAGHGNVNYSELAQYQSFLPDEVYFPATIALAPGGVGNGAVKDAQTPYFAEFNRAGIKPDMGASIMWDPTMIVIGALRKFGPGATAQQLRDYIVNLHGWAGVNGMYDFRDGSQRGIGVQSMVVDRYDNAKQQLTAVSRPGGTMK